MTTAAVAIELLLSAWAGALVYVIGLFVTHGQSPLPLAGAAALLCATSLLLWPPVFNRLVATLARRIDSSLQLGDGIGFGHIAVWAPFYAGLIALGGVVLFFVIRAVHPIALGALPTVVGAWGITLAVSVVTIWIPVNLYLRDGVLFVVLTSLVGAATAVVVVVVWRLSMMLSEFTWAVLVALASAIGIGPSEALWPGLPDRRARLGYLRRILSPTGSLSHD